MSPFHKFRIEKHIGDGIFVLAISSLLLLAELSTTSFAEIEYWTVKAGNRVLAVMRTEEDAGKAVEQAEHYYDEEDAEDIAVNAEPTIAVEQKHYELFKAPRTVTVKDAVGRIINNAESDDPDVKITTTQTISGTRPVAFKTVEKKSDALIEDARAVDTVGVKGEEKVSEKVIMVNGKQVSSEELSAELTKSPKDKIVLLGTRVDDQEDSKDNEGSAGRAFNVRRNPDGITFRGDLPGKEMGKKAAEYGLKFVGNPYVWAGESLERGADCSGFTLAVYKHFGISLPHDAHAQRNYGVEVSSLKNARPGDLICFHGHIGIYIGNNKIVHAMNVANGMTVSTIGYNRKPIVTIRRLFK